MQTIITITLNSANCVFHHFGVKTALVTTFTRNLLPKRHFWGKVRFPSFCVKTALALLLLEIYYLNDIFGAKCVFHRLCLTCQTLYCYSQSTAKTTIFGAKCSSESLLLKGKKSLHLLRYIKAWLSQPVHSKYKGGGLSQ